MSKSNPIIVGIGEVLWDILPDAAHLGGAPTNFAYHCHVQGAHSFVVSAVGDDELGRKAMRRLQQLGLDTRFLQAVRARPTGTVSVEIGPSGGPGYVIREDVAWDCITWDQTLPELALAADAVCLGTLAQRAFVSRSTIMAFVQHTRPTCLRILDLNLRQHFYQRELITTTLQICNVLKLNDEEWTVLAELLELNSAVPDGIRELMRRYDLRLVALTQGPRGSLLVTPDGLDRQPGRNVHVVDTVGAGDAFTASLAVGLIQGASVSQMHSRAAQIAAYVCTQAGAMPPIGKELLA